MWTGCSSPGVLLAKTAAPACLVEMLWWRLKMFLSCFTDPLSVLEIARKAALPSPPLCLKAGAQGPSPHAVPGKGPSPLQSAALVLLSPDDPFASILQYWHDETSWQLLRAHTCTGTPAFFTTHCAVLYLHRHSFPRHWCRELFITTPSPANKAFPQQRELFLKVIRDHYLIAFLSGQPIYYLSCNLICNVFSWYFLYFLLYFIIISLESLN